MLGNFPIGFIRCVMNQEIGEVRIITFKGFKLERIVVGHRVSTERFALRPLTGKNGTAQRYHYEYRFLDCDHPHNTYAEFESIKWMIAEPENRSHSWFGEWVKLRTSLVTTPKFKSIGRVYDQPSAVYEAIILDGSTKIRIYKDSEYFQGFTFEFLTIDDVVNPHMTGNYTASWHNGATLKETIEWVYRVLSDKECQESIMKSMILFTTYINSQK